MNTAPELNELLQVQYPYIINRYKKDHPQNKLSAEEAWQDLLRYFWLLDKHNTDKRNHPTDEALDFACVIYQEMHEIDDMWHTFLLFTKEYEVFCKKYFGYFIHHMPNTDEQPLEDNSIHFERYLSYIYDNLGEATLKSWFSEYFESKI